MAKNILESNIMVGKLVAVLVALLLVAVLVYPVINTVGNGGGGAGTTIDNEGAEWLKLGYAEGTDFEFVITNDGADVTVGEQTGPLGDMIYYADENRVIFSKGTTMYLMTAGDNSNIYTFNDSVSVTNSNGTITIYDGSTVIDTASSPARAYYPDASGGYGFFTNGNLNLLENELKVAVGSYAGVFAYNENIVTPDDVDLGLDMTGDYATGDVTWAVSGDDESNDEPPVQPLASQSSMATMSGYANAPLLGTANPPDGTLVGDLYYTFADYSATIVGYSSSIDWSQFTTISDSVTYEGQYYPVNAIGDYAFQNCTEMGYIEWENYGRSIESIGAYAFSGCTNLQFDNLPQYAELGAYAFQNCSSLGTIDEIPTYDYDGNEINHNLSAGVFSGCTNLGFNNGLPYRLTSIGDYAFQNCTNLSNSLPDYVNSIGNYAFQNCTSLTTSSLPEDVTSIGNYAFQNCTNITISTIPSTVTSIGNHAFDGCTSLATIVIEGNPTIGADAFANCPNAVIVVAIDDLYYSFNGNNATLRGCNPELSNYTEMAIPDTVTYNGVTYTITEVGERAFYSDPYIRFTSLPSNLISVGNLGFYNAEVSGPLPDTVTTVGNRAFMYSFITSLSEGLTNVGEYAFSGCTRLSMAELPVGLTVISNGAFKDCSQISLTSIPSTVTGIGENAFSGCSGIKSMIFLGSPTIGYNAFKNTGIKEILNFGETEITTTSYGLNADSVQDYVGALGYVAPTHIQEGSSDSGYDVDGVSMTVLKLVPIILMVCILLVLVMPMIQSRTE